MFFFYDNTGCSGGGRCLEGGQCLPIGPSLHPLFLSIEYSLHPILFSIKHSILQYSSSEGGQCLPLGPSLHIFNIHFHSIFFFIQYQFLSNIPFSNILYLRVGSVSHLDQVCTHYSFSSNIHCHSIFFFIQYFFVQYSLF